jgi:hypothetical protein
VAIRSDRLRILWSLWTLGALFLWRVALFVALAGAGVYVSIGVMALILGFEASSWFRFSALVWAPLAAGAALASTARRMKLSWSRAGRPADLELVAGWRVGGLAMGSEPSWINTGAAIMVIGGILAADLAPPMLAIELVEWISSGDWFDLTLAQGLALPLSLLLLVAGLMLCVEGLNLGERSLGRNGRWFPIAE